MMPSREFLEPTACPYFLQRPVPLDLAVSCSLIASHLHEHRVDGATSPLNEAKPC
jgi:hypothetical protein